MRLFLYRSTVYLAALVFPTIASAACSVAIVFALDISRSVSPDEFDYQKFGLARALQSADVRRVIAFYPEGIMATVTVWSSVGQQQSVPWSLLTTNRSIDEFARKISEMRRPYRFDLTAIADALLHAGSILAENPVACDRMVIDVSGDGVTSVVGQHPAAVANALSASGVTINALVIAGSKPDPVLYYTDQVVRGNGSFMIIADGFQDFEESMQRKLLRELVPTVSSAEGF